MVLEQPGDLDDLLTLALVGLALEHSQLGVEHEHVEPFGVLMLGFQLSWQPGDPVGQCGEIGYRDVVAGFGLSEAFDDFEVLDRNARVRRFGGVLVMPRRVDHGERREELAAAATRVIVNEGMAAASVRRISEEAGYRPVC